MSCSSFPFSDDCESLLFDIENMASESEFEYKFNENQIHAENPTCATIEKSNSFTVSLMTVLNT